MENATDALIMAASVLLLVIALTVSITSFSKLKSQTQEILYEKDQLQSTTDESGDFLNYLKNDNELRTVGSDTIITTLRRLRKESYTMYIYPDQSTIDTIGDANGIPYPDCNVIQGNSLEDKNYLNIMRDNDMKMNSSKKTKKFRSTFKNNNSKEVKEFDLENDLKEINVQDFNL